VYPPVGLTQTVEVEVQLLETGYGAPPLPFGGGGLPLLTGGGGGGDPLEDAGGAADEDAGGAEDDDAGALLEEVEQTPEVSGLIPNCEDHWNVQRSLLSTIRPQ